MTSQSFRDSLNSLGWTQRETDVPVSTSQRQSLLSSLQSWNPFGDSGYVRLPTTESSAAPLPAPSRREEEEGWFVLATRPRKFVILWTLGSILFLSSFAAMMGPWAYVQHLASAPRLPFTGAYFGSIALTLYFSLGLHSTILTLISAILQLACLLWYLVSYFPMGSSSLRFATSLGARRAAAWMTS
ncbi:MAG: Protein transport protein sft2 [Sporothrix epigloea]